MDVQKLITFVQQFIHKFWRSQRRNRMQVDTATTQPYTVETAKPNPEVTYLGVDLGMGAIKLFGAQGGTQLPSFVAVGSGVQTARMTGFARQLPAMQIKVGTQPYFVGLSAHDYGRAIENLDYDRLTASPEIVALFYGALTAHIRDYGCFHCPLVCLVGMPLETLTEEQAKTTATAVRKWMKGNHTWQADGQRYQVLVEDVRVTSQPAGALFDYLLDDEGAFVTERKPHMKKELGIVSVGFNTIELLAVRDKSTVQRFTTGSTVGVRRLIELLNQDNHYSLGELDALLRSHALDVSDVLPIWAREVNGVIERRWGQQWRRFERIIVVGGGALLLGDYLMGRFGGKTHLPDQPVLATARGLYKQALAQMARQRGD